MKILDFLRKKKKEEKTIKINEVSFIESNISENNFEASKQATIGREMFQEIDMKRKNVDIEKSKGWYAESEGTATFNMNAAKQGSKARATMLDSKVSCNENKVKADSGSPYDIRISEPGKSKKVDVQSKMSNNYKSAAKYQDDEKYKGMQRLVAKGQRKLIKKNNNLNISDETRENITEEIKYTDSSGKIVKSDKISLDLMKNKRKLKSKVFKKEAKETMTSSLKAAENSMKMGFLVNVFDDIFEQKEIDLKKNAKNSVDMGIKAFAYTGTKDLVVNKLKYISKNSFSTVATALNLGPELKKIYLLNESNTPKETIKEEIEALILKTSVGFLGCLGTAIPFGGGGLVAINYIGNKIIAKYFYSEISLYVRELRMKNKEQEKLFKMLKDKKKKQDNLIDEFLNLVDDCCAKRQEVTKELLLDSSRENISKASAILTNKKIKSTTDQEIDLLFEEELII